MSLNLPSDALATTPRSVSSIVLRWSASLVLLAWSLVLIAWLILQWGILPHVQNWRVPIEQRISAALGTPVHIGEIRVRSSGWVPALELRDVVLLDAQQHEALRLPAVSAAVSARSLLAFELRFEQLLIDGPELEIRRDAAGRIFVAGLPMNAADEGGGAAADWFFSQHEFAIRKGTLRWIDERRPAPPLELKDVDLVVRNGVRSHALRIDATPTAEWGDRFSLQGQFTQSLLARSGQWQHWTGTLHADLPRVDVRQLRGYVDLPVQFTEGVGALRAWLDLAQGQPRAATVDVALRSVVVQLGSDVEPMDFEAMAGRLMAERDAGTVRVAAQRFGFVTAQGLTWPEGDMKLLLRQVQNDTPATATLVTGGEFSADRLDLATIAALVEKVPVSPALRQMLVEVAPQGQVSALGARWDGPPDAPAHYQVNARIDGLTLMARTANEPDGVGRPGLRNASIDVNANEHGGSARLAINDGAIDLPGVFEESLVPLQALSAQLAWQIEARRADGALPRVELKVKGAQFANADAKGQFDATWRTGSGLGAARGGRLPGVLELSGRLDTALAQRAARYMPVRLPEHTRQYVAQAVRGGTITSASFSVKGDLWDFPFHKPQQGEFRIATKLRDVSFDYVPSLPATASAPSQPSTWPGMTQVSGELVFERSAMSVRDAKARIGGFELSGINGGIADLDNHATLVIDGNGRGPTADALAYINTSPIGGWTHHALVESTATGKGELKLALRIPLDDAAQSTVKGSYTLNGNDVRIRSDLPVLAAARGRLDFTQSGFAIAGGAAQMLGGDVAFEGGQQADGVLRFSGQGTLTAEGLRKAHELGALSVLARSLSGRAAYRLNLGFQRGLSDFLVTSNLVGMGSDLPAPLRKSAEGALPLRLQVRPTLPATTAVTDAGLSGGASDTLSLDLGTVLHAQYVRDVSGAVPRVLRGGIGVGALVPAPTPAAGVQAHVELPVFDADAWRAVVDGVGSMTNDGAGSGASYVPSSVALKMGELTVASRRLTQLVAGLTQVPSPLGAQWRANVTADQLAGYAEWQPGSASEPGALPGRLYARLARLSLPRAEAESVESMLDAPSSMPALDVVIDNLELRGKQLGKVEIEAAQRMAAGAAATTAIPTDLTPEWRVTRLSMRTPEAQLEASGQWVRSAGDLARRRSIMNFRLDLSDAGAFAERLGTGRAIKGGKGRLSGQIGWVGSPLSPDIASLFGEVGVSIDAGQFLKADAGVARLFGVLSLQALPRRLVLDFRDLFQEGFPFDNVAGDVKIAEGIASTNNLRMRGVSAAVLMEGKADLNRETQDLHVVVVPEINTGTAALAYAVINPAIGLGAFVAQMVLRRPFIEASTRQFHVSGSWTDPKVERVENKSVEPVPGAGGATSPSAPVPPAVPPVTGG